jgi:hypothetical protein
MTAVKLMSVAELLLEWTQLRSMHKVFKGHPNFFIDREELEDYRLEVAEEVNRRFAKKKEFRSRFRSRKH